MRSVCYAGCMVRMSASEFRATCLAVLDRVGKTGETVTILEHGKPIARLVPAVQDEEFPQIDLRGSVHVLGDIVSPVLSADAWEAERSGH